MDRLNDKDYPVADNGHYESSGPRGVDLTLYNVSRLAALLKLAESAHKDSGDSSDNWPTWYARYLVGYGVRV